MEDQQQKPADAAQTPDPNAAATPPASDENALEAPSVSDGSATSAPTEQSAEVDVNTDDKNKPKQKKSFIKRLTSINIYLLLFILVVLIAGIAVFLTVQLSKKEVANQNKSSGSEAISTDTLNKLKTSDVKVGDAKQTLNVESNAIFAGTVLVRGSLDVAGQLKLGGPLSLTGLTVGGTASVDNLQANGASINGNVGIQGQLSVQKNATFAGGASFGGPISAPQITVSNFQLSQDLQIPHHITVTGSQPSITPGTALGGGGTVSLNGTDTAGTIAVNTGSSPPAGCFATITFVQRFNSTPHVVVGPVGSAAGSVNFYVNRLSNSFSICSANSPPAGQSFAFDYIVID